VVVVWIGHGQASSTGWPTVFLRQRSASVALVGSEPFGAQMQGGSQVCVPTATRRMKRQSVAAGLAPVLTGWAQSPGDAIVGADVATATANAKALATATREPDPAILDT